jgi:hypothetical protein
MRCCCGGGGGGCVHALAAAADLAATPLRAAVVQHLLMRAHDTIDEGLRNSLRIGLLALIRWFGWERGDGRPGQRSVFKLSLIGQKYMQKCVFLNHSTPHT